MPFDGVKIRPFREADAPRLVEWLAALAPAEDVYTSAVLIHQRRMLPARKRPLWLVAVLDGEPVGLGRDEPQIFGGRGQRRTWVGVHPDRRRRGIGSQLWHAIEAHARSLGGNLLRSWVVMDIPDGERFLLARGFSRTERELQSWVDPRGVDADEVDRARRNAEQNGFRVTTLRAVLARMEPALRRVFLTTGADVPHHDQSAARVAPSTFRRVILWNPSLDQDCSTVVLNGSEPVSLCWLKGDREVGRYGVEFTGTAAAWRGRGLATLAKLVAYQLAAQAGVPWIGTANDENNAQMLAVNRRLGHRPLPDLLVYERTA